MRREVGMKRETRVRWSSATCFTTASWSGSSDAAAAAALTPELRRCELLNLRASASFSCDDIADDIAGPALLLRDVNFACRRGVVLQAHFAYLPGTKGLAIRLETCGGVVKEVHSASVHSLPAAAARQAQPAADKSIFKLVHGTAARHMHRSVASVTDQHVSSYWGIYERAKQPQTAFLAVVLPALSSHSDRNDCMLLWAFGVRRHSAEKCAYKKVRFSLPRIHCGGRHLAQMRPRHAQMSMRCDVMWMCESAFEYDGHSISAGRFSYAPGSCAD